jgi:hypothetical protein
VTGFARLLLITKIRLEYSVSKNKKKSISNLLFIFKIFPFLIRKKKEEEEEEEKKQRNKKKT